MQRRIVRLTALLPCLAAACVGGIVQDPKAPGASPTGPSGTGGPSTAPPTPGTPGAPGTPATPGQPGATAPPGGPTAPPATGLTIPPAKPGAGMACKNVPGPRLLRRLTTTELNNTLQDLFGDPAAPPNTALSDPEVLGFHVDAAQLLVRDLGAQQLADFAEETARWAITNKLPTLSTCATMDPTCRQTFIKSFGRKAFREPLTDAQVKAYDALFAAETSFNEGLTAVISAMLQSPNLLYRRELGKPDPATPGQFLLSQQEVASNLSYLLTQGPPDAQLGQAADGGALTTRAQLDAQADRLMKTPRGRRALAAFARGWLGLDRLATVVKNDKVFALTDQLRKDLVGETETFFIDTFDRNGTVPELFTASYSFLNQSLSQFYGTPNGAGGAGYLKTMLVPGQRDPGILAHASVLATHATGVDSSPVKRGKLVRTRILCQSLPDPPADVDTMLKPPAPNQTTRQRLQQHQDNPACSACHQTIDPIGVGFERYDGFGRRRTTDNGAPIDATGKLTGTAAGDLPFDGVDQLEPLLARSPEATACVVRYWSYFAYGVASWPQDACALSSLVDEAAQGQFSLRSILMAVIHSPHFTHRVGP
jgi:hypothetical protein